MICLLNGSCGASVQIDLIHKGIKTGLTGNPSTKEMMSVQIDLIHKGIKTYVGVEEIMPRPASVYK